MRHRIAGTAVWVDVCEHGVALNAEDKKKATYCLGCYPYGERKFEPTGDSIEKAKEA